MITLSNLLILLDNILSHPFLSKFKNKALNIKTYQSILQITLTAPSVNLNDFYREIREKAKDKFNIPYHAKIAPVISVRAAYLYDAVLIYGNIWQTFFWRKMHSSMNLFANTQLKPPQKCSRMAATWGMEERWCRNTFSTTSTHQSKDFKWVLSGTKIIKRSLNSMPFV